MKFSVDRQKHLVTFTPEEVRARVLMFPTATDGDLIAKVLELGENQHHAWGVKELLGANVEVAVARLNGAWWERFGQDWRLPDTSGYDLIYSNHNCLIRTPLESYLRLRNTPFVSLVYAGEPLFAPKRHFGLLCMTPHAYSRFKSLESVQVRYAPWGIDTDSTIHQPIEASGEHFISTGVTGRDFKTLMTAAAMIEDSVVIAARGRKFSNCPPNVKVVDQFITPLGVRDLYAGSYAALLVLQRDDKKRYAVGWTNMLELMAVGLPIIKTRTGSLDDIVDLEAIGAGILVEPESPQAIASAMRKLRGNPELRRSMANAGIAYVRSHFTMKQFGERLIEIVGAARSLR